MALSGNGTRIMLRSTTASAVAEKNGKFWRAPPFLRASRFLPPEFLISESVFRRDFFTFFC